jgi:hypothetical protein
MGEFRKLAGLLQDQPGIVLAVSFRKFEKGQSFAVSLVEEAARKEELQSKGFTTHTYRKEFKEPHFTAEGFLAFLGQQQGYTSRSEAGRYRSGMIKATAKCLDFENSLLFFYSNHCDTCKRLTPVL